MGDSAWTSLIEPVLRIVEPVRIGHGVEVVEVAEEFIEAVKARKILIEIA
jgi:hypothetical protein